MLKLGLQVSSVTPLLETAKAAQSTLYRIAALGYHTVQLSGQPISDGELAAALKYAGLACASFQENSPFAYGKTPAKLLETAAALHCKYLVVSFLPPEASTPKRLAAYGEKLAGLSELAAKAGVKLAYRPTRFDFRDMEGQPVFARLLALLPDEVTLALCIHATFGQVSYAELLEQYQKRLEIVYFMDSLSLADGASKPVPLGEGDHNWKPILSACARSGVKHIMVGQDSWDRDPFACAYASKKYLSQMGLN